MELFAEGKTKKNNGKINFNPFPGLRPFSTDESHLFFGREGQSQEVLKFLAEHKFVALLGTSGSGKSSLMYCGVIPILQGGFITEAGSNWKVVTTKPGQHPVRNLAIALSSLFTTNESDKDLQEDFIYSTLSASSIGLSEAIKYIPRSKNENILLLVDQFEELFRFRKIKNTTEAFNEVLAYIKLLIELLRQKDNPAYIVITMRSDFIGECAQFQDLTKLINDSHYLIPQMTRDNFREAIEGPIAVGGGTITPFLVQQLLNDIGDNPDQLPILQHALMRTWDAWVKSGRISEPIDIKDYENIGKLTKALSEHANEAYNELTPREKEICQSIFKTLTEKAGDNRGVRRPTAVAEIAEIAIASPNEIINVIDHFRIIGRSFLAPASGVKLNEESVIDISHESLMRIWDKLIVWVSEEYEAVQMYKRLSDSAEKFQLGEAALWRPPDLQLALNWSEKQKPTLTWAKRHNPAFERTMVFLETSNMEYVLEEENKIRLQKKALRRTRMFAIVLGAASIVSIFFMINSFISSQEAKKQKNLADTRRVEAEQQKEEAEKQRQFADDAKLLAQKSEKDAIAQKELADQERFKAQNSAKEALRQKEIANTKSIEASEQREKAEVSAEEAKVQAQRAEESSKAAQKLRMLSIAQSMAVKSEQIDIDTTLKGLIAYQSYKFNNEYGGNSFNADVYKGLYFSQKFFYGNQVTDYIAHTEQIRSIQFLPGSKTFFSTGSSGKVYIWNENKNQDSTSFYNTNSLNRTMEISADGKRMLIGTGLGELLEIEIKNVNPLLKQVVKQNSAIVYGGYLNNNTILCIDVAGTWKLVEVGQPPKILKENLPVKKIIVHNKEYWAISSTGTLLKINSFDPVKFEEFKISFSTDTKENYFSNYLTEGKIIRKVNAIAISPDGKYMATGDIDGDVLIWDYKTKGFIRRLTGHTARINEIAFDKDSKYLATASNDGKAIMWKAGDFDLPPYLLTDNEAWVMTITFNNEGSAIIVGYADGKIRRWPTSSDEFVKKIVSKINRNLTNDEWQQYVAKDITYKKTIDSLPGLSSMH